MTGAEGWAADERERSARGEWRQTMGSQKKSSDWWQKSPNIDASKTKHKQQDKLN